MCLSGPHTGQLSTAILKTSVLYSVWFAAVVQNLSVYFPKHLIISNAKASLETHLMTSYPSYNQRNV